MGCPSSTIAQVPTGFHQLPDLDLYYEDCVIGGPGSFVVVADGFQDFARAIRRKLLLEIRRSQHRLYLWCDLPRTKFVRPATRESSGFLRIGCSTSIDGTDG